MKKPIEEKFIVQRFIISTLSYVVPTMILGYMWHLVLFKEVYDSLGVYNRLEPIIPLGFLSMIIQGAIVSYLYPYFAKDRYSMTTAVKFSLVIGLFLFSVSTLANAAKIHVSDMQTWMLIQVAFHLTQFLTVGLFLGLSHKR